MPLKTSSEIGLIGFFGHTYADDNGRRVIQYQFKIIRRLNDDAYVVQLFSFLDGEPTNLWILPEADLLDPEKVKLYATRPLWLAAYEKDHDKHWGRNMPRPEVVK